MTILGIEPDNVGRAAEPEVSGKWAEIIFKPDLMAEDQITIGVCFKRSKNGEFHYRLTSSLDKLSALYGHDHMEQFRFLLACAKEHFSLYGDKKPLSPHLIVGWFRPASGVSVDEILDSQFERMVLIARNQNPVFPGS